MDMDGPQISDYKFNVELMNIEEEDNNILKITFKVVPNEPIVFSFGNRVFAVTENYDIYELDLRLFPVLKLRYLMKHALVENAVQIDRYVIDLSTFGFSDANEFKQFMKEHPSYMRYISFLYQIMKLLLLSRPWLALLLISSISSEYNVKIGENESEAKIEKILIKTLTKKFEINNSNVTFKILNRNGDALVMVEKTPFIDGNGIITYDEIAKILKEKPDAILNPLIIFLMFHLI